MPMPAVDAIAFALDRVMEWDDGYFEFPSVQNVKHWANSTLTQITASITLAKPAKPVVPDPLQLQLYVQYSQRRTTA